MSSTSAKTGLFRVADLSQSHPTRVTLTPDTPQRAQMAQAVGALALRKLRFDATLSPAGKSGWRLDAQLGATVEQACVVTLDPVTTRIDTDVARMFVPKARLALPEAGSETEMPEDDSIEPLGEVIDLMAVLQEALSLALPAYPRKEGVDLGAAVFAGEGVVPMTDEDSKPFAGLAGLRDKLQGKDEEP